MSGEICIFVHRRLLPAEKNGLELSHLVHGNADRTHLPLRDVTSPTGGACYMSNSTQVRSPSLIENLPT